MANLKFKFKVPSIIALTLAGTALTTHHAHAAEKHKIKLQILMFLTTSTH